MAATSRKRFKVLHWMGMVLLVLVLVFILASLSASRRLAEVQNKLQESGRPLAIEELFPAEIPDERNAAIELSTAVEQLREEAFGTSDLFAELQDAAKALLDDPGDAEALERFGRLHDSGAVAEALALVAEGIRKGGYHNELDLSQGFMLELPHIGELMGWSHILAATVELQVADGDQAGAWDTALTSLRLANVLEGEPLLISQLVRANAISRAIESIRRLDSATAPASHLAEMDTLLNRIENPAPFVTALDAERLIGGQVFDASGAEMAELTSGAGVSTGHGIILGAYRFLPPLRQRDRAEHANALREMADSMAHPYRPDDVAHARDIHASIPRYSILAKLAVPSLDQLKPKMTSTFAEASITRAGLAAQQYHHQHGSYPPDLATLGRDDLRDPFNGEPLHYQADSTGFTISSVGPGPADAGAAGSDALTWSYPEPREGAP